MSHATFGKWQPNKNVIALAVCHLNITRNSDIRIPIPKDAGFNRCGISGALKKDQGRFTHFKQQFLTGSELVPSVLLFLFGHKFTGKHKTRVVGGSWLVAFSSPLPCSTSSGRSWFAAPESSSTLCACSDLSRGTSRNSSSGLRSRLCSERLASSGPSCGP